MRLPESKTRSLGEIVIIGRGKVGQSLTQLFKQQDHCVSNIGRSKPAQIAALQGADIIFLCVDDGSIESLCVELAPSFPTGCIVCHCSGALDSTILSSAYERGCATASTHPLNSFPTIESARSLLSSTNHGSYMYAEGDDKALEKLLLLFGHAGFVSQVIEREAKPMYHAACVFACNYLVSLMDLSLESAAFAGLDRDQFWASIQPLMQTTLENISHEGTVAALSGPIARGDNSTVESHIKHIGKHSMSLKHSYVDLGLRALEIAVKKNELSKDQLSSLRNALSQTN